MKKITYLLCLFLIHAGISMGQDIHFSAMDYSPLTLNPALAGANKDLSATVHYRKQWNAVASPYETIAGGASIRLNNNKIKEQGILALGVNFYNDVAGLSKMTTNGGSLSFAYHLVLAKDHFLGLGLQGGFGSRSIGVNDGRWGNQYNGTEYDPTISGENFGSPSFSYFDANAGLVYSYHPTNNSRNNNGTNLNIGLAAYHLSQPNYSFIQSEDENLYIRLSAFAMAQIGINDSKTAIEPQLIAQFQGPSIETLLGTDFRFFLSESRGGKSKTSVALGAFWRNRDALMTRFSVQFSGVDIGLVYDFNIFNDLQSISNSKGAFEVFLRYGMNFSKSGFKTRFR